MPKVGLGVVLVNKEGKILVEKRIGSHAQKYSIPGGHLELGETFEHGAIREIKEETSLNAKNPKVIGVTNNLETYESEGVHYISVILLVTEYTGELKIMEPDKCEKQLWVDPKNLPEPHFDASRLGVKCYLNGTFYEQPPEVPPHSRHV
ncbi:MAG: NUDIX domain-containing protein [Candidatus Jorgensenbacteria bacterium]